jgi:UDPglucose 6-dehydrogenase
MNIVVVGSGYVGLVTGVCFAELGLRVTCIDHDAGKIDRLMAGDIPIYEPGLQNLVHFNQKAGRLSFTTEAAACIGQADAVFIAVGTPTRKGDNHADLQYIFAAARDIAPHLRGYTTVVTKSTVPVGTGRRIASVIRDINPTATFDMVSNPEFLREGTAIHDFMRPDRVVVGAEAPEAVEVMRRLYEPLTRQDVPLVVTTLETAEMAKYAANAFLAMKITFINQMADLCEVSQANVNDVAKIMGMDKRIGSKFLRAGPGYGGSCFPKDTRALAETARTLGVDLGLVSQTMTYNDTRKHKMVDRILASFQGSVSGKTLAILGLTFKPGTDDMRDAASLVIVPALKAAGAHLKLYDPKGMEEAQTYLGDNAGQWCANALDTLSGADGAVLITEWDEFRALSPETIAKTLKSPVVVDLRNVYDVESMASAGVAYTSLGRPVASVLSSPVVRAKIEAL